MLNFTHAENPTLIDIGTEEVGEVIEYAQMIFSDFMPILTLVFGVMIGVIVIGVLIKLLRG